MTTKKTDVATVAAAKSSELQKSGPSVSVRFTEKVISELQSNMDTPVQMTSHQRKIIQNAFIKIDLTLKQNEQKRMAKSEQYRDGLAFTWENVNINKLAQDIAAISAVGLDPLQKNHVHLIPYKNGHLGKFDFEPIIGYRGSEIKAMKFGLNAPTDVIVELVYENDEFMPIKKSSSNKHESYEFKIVKPFDRGEIIGGFYFLLFEDNPSKNKIHIMPLADILKRKPDYASAEFWGGEKDEWKNGQKTGKKTAVAGWFAEMCYKTVFRAAYDSITIDSEKISDHLAKVVQMEENYLYGEDKQNAISDMKSDVNQKAASGPAIRINHDSDAEVVKDDPEPSAVKPNEDFGADEAAF